ncbi:MAG: PilZ domain-containing protein, partial [Candidatus Omnitrophica bacterium]|nr:PilZ domain-containing protein [Candidatus Omnitrophota bacterium]
MPDHRSCPRWQVNWQARLKLEGQEEHAPCTLRDINFKGARVCLEQKLSVDTRLNLNLCLCPEASLEVEVWVVWHRNIGELNEYGVYFSKIKEADKEKIYQFMNSNFKE